MKKLISGIQQFQKEQFGPLQGLFEQLSEGQQPETLFITCSDSRIDPCLITQTQPGDLFVIRNAGNIVPTHGANVGGESATIEYAVAALKVKNIVVCGHSHCGAMNGLLNLDQLESLPCVASWLTHSEKVRRIVTENYEGLTPEELLNVAIEENVLVQLENLRTLPSVGSALAKGDIELYGWVYKFETGEILAYEPEEGKFLPLDQSELADL